MFEAGHGTIPKWLAHLPGAPMPGRKSKYEAHADVVNLVLGTFLFLAPWTFGFVSDLRQQGVYTASATNAWASGAVIGIAAALAIVDFAEWKEWVSVLTGLWVAVSPWLLGFAGDPSARWTCVSVGIIVFVLAAIELDLAEQRARSRFAGDSASGVGAVQFSSTVIRARRAEARRQSDFDMNATVIPLTVSGSTLPNNGRCKQRALRVPIATAQASEGTLTAGRTEPPVDSQSG